MFFENKVLATLDVVQLWRHLAHFESEDDRLLVITPRSGDRKLVADMNDERIVFYTWPEVAQLLNIYGNGNVTARRIVDYFFKELGSVVTGYSSLIHLKNSELKWGYDNFTIYNTSSERNVLYTEADSASFQIGPFVAPSKETQEIKHNCNFEPVGYTHNKLVFYLWGTKEIVELKKNRKHGTTYLPVR